MSRPDRHFCTPYELSQLMELRDVRDMSFELIVMRLNLSSIQCQNKYWAVTQRKKTEQGIKPEARTAPNKAIIDRERRHRARYMQDITGLAFGDPPPGFSALDKMRARA